MSVWFFYLILVFFSQDVQFSIIWFLISLAFSGSEIVHKYKYTANPAMNGKDAS